MCGSLKQYKFIERTRKGTLKYNLAISRALLEIKDEDLKV